MVYRLTRRVTWRGGGSNQIYTMQHATETPTAVCGAYEIYDEESAVTGVGKENGLYAQRGNPVTFQPFAKRKTQQISQDGRTKKNGAVQRRPIRAGRAGGWYGLLHQGWRIDTDISRQRYLQWWDTLIAK